MTPEQCEELSEFSQKFMEKHNLTPQNMIICFANSIAASCAASPCDEKHFEEILIWMREIYLKKRKE